jgi:hypothetical protein
MTCQRCVKLALSCSTRGNYTSGAPPRSSALMGAMQGTTSRRANVPPACGACGPCASAVAGTRCSALTTGWHIDDEWWRAQLSRRYIVVHLEGELRVTLFVDRVAASWWGKRA